MSSCRRFLLLALCVFALTAASSAWAQEAVAPATATAPAAPTAAELKARAAARADRVAMQGELQENFERAKSTVAGLDARYAATSDAATRALIQRHVEATKRAAELESFRIQLRHAQAMGRAADARELQGVLDAQLRQPALALPPLPPLEQKLTPAAPVQAKKESGK